MPFEGLLDNVKLNALFALAFVDNAGILILVTVWSSLDSVLSLEKYNLDVETGAAPPVLVKVIETAMGVLAFVVVLGLIVNAEVCKSAGLVGGGVVGGLTGPLPQLPKQLPLFTSCLIKLPGNGPKPLAKLIPTEL